MKIGILNPGKMGSSLAIAAQMNGHEVIWASEGRSEMTADRAETIMLRDVLTIENMCKESDVIVSICMGAGVFPNAKAVVESKFKGIYVDANHVGSKSSELHLGNLLNENEIRYVEASIYGWPYPHEPNPDAERTMYLSCDGEDNFDAFTVFDCFNGAIFECLVSEKESAKEIKRSREVADRSDCAPFVNHGYGVVEFHNVMADMGDEFVDRYMERRKLTEPSDYYIDDDGFYVNRGGYRFTPDQIENAPRRFLNLLPSEATDDEVKFHSEIETAIGKSLNAYKGIFPEIVDCMRWRSDAHIAEYPEGSGMGMHHDNAIGGAGENENPVFNVLSISLILSDRCTGGELVFKHPNVEIAPVKGNLIIYPSGFLGAHAVNDIKSGTRISYLEFVGQGDRSGQIKPI